MADHTMQQRILNNSIPEQTMEQRISGVRKGQYDVEIIESVRDRPEIYDKAHENHKNPTVKEMEWRRIAVRLKVPVGAVMKRWTVLRERFTAEKRKSLPPGASSWWLMEHMTWLDAHIQPRQSGKSKMYKYDSPSSQRNSIPPLVQSPYSEFAEDDDRSQPGSPIDPIAYPEVQVQVLMDTHSPPGSCSNSIDGEYGDQFKYNYNNGDNLNRWANAVLDVDEGAAARVLAALRAIEDPAVRHQLRCKVHSIAQEIEVAGLKQSWGYGDIKRHDMRKSES